MAIRTVLKMGDPQLLQVAHPCDPTSVKTQQVIEDMLDTMRAVNGAGLAATQIGILKRIIMFEVKNNPRYPYASPVPLTILINPEIEILSSETICGWEGCLSVPGLRGVVSRYKKIRLTAFDREGNRIEQIVEDFPARVIQHECDHLNGVLFPMRVTNFHYFGYETELGERIFEYPVMMD